MNERTFCFIDESGNKFLSTEKDGTSKFFVLGAVLVKNSSLAEVQENAEIIRRIAFENGEMKSTGIGKNIARRKKLLSDIAKLPIKFIILAVEKGEISKESGLAWHKSFFKFANNLLITKLIAAHTPISFIQDEHGSSEFMQEFIKYMKKQHPESDDLDLFNEKIVEPTYIYDFVESSSNVLVQIADIIAGSYGRIVEGTEDSDFEHFYYRTLSRNMLFVDQWPPSYKFRRIELFPESKMSESVDDNIKYHCMKKVNQFLQSNPKDIESDKVDEMKSFVRFLLYKLETGYERTFILTKEIVDFLSAAHSKKFNKQYIRTNIVAKIRDRGVIISSGTKGYKIPNCANDIESFFDHANSIIPSMVNRVKDANDQIQSVTFGEANLMQKTKYDHLYKIVQSVIMKNPVKFEL